MTALVLVIPDDELDDWLAMTSAWVDRWGVATAPSIIALRDLFAANISPSPPLAANFVDTDPDRPHPALVTYDEAAAILGYSKRTVSRLTAAGNLERAGRRITRASIDTYRRAHR